MIKVNTKRGAQLISSTQRKAEENFGGWVNTFLKKWFRVAEAYRQRENQRQKVLNRTWHIYIYITLN